MKKILVFFGLFLSVLPSVSAASYSVNLIAGTNFVSNQLDIGSNTLVEVFPPGTLPDNTIVAFWTRASITSI
jgi:hypothetical protein